MSRSQYRDHRKLIKKESDAQYRLHRGIALAALQVKATGQVMRDAGGRPLHYANQAANGFGFRELEQKVKGRSARSFSFLEEEQPIEVPASFEETGKKRFIAEGGRWIRVE